MIKTDKNCIGCGACADACPVNCITMEYDEEGFLYPTVNTADCINCSSCNKVCIIENNIPEIETIKHKMLALGAAGSMMSGSGPTVFGLFDDEAAAKRAYIEFADAGDGMQVFLTEFVG